MKVAKLLLSVALRTAWNVADKNRDGSISKREAKEFWDLIKRYFKS